MACRTGKIEHPTRDAALTHVRELEYKNSLRGDYLKSVGLEAYPCRECGHYHVGRRHIPSVYHYTTMKLLDGILKADALKPARPKRVPRRELRQLTGERLLNKIASAEHAPLVWFSWNEAWDFRVHPTPHPPAAWIGASADERTGGGLVRIVVPASIATLRWRDYLQRDRTPRWMSDDMATYGNPADWLATDQPVPFSLMRSIECRYRGAWAAVGDVTDEDFAAYLSGKEHDGTL